MQPSHSNPRHADLIAAVDVQRRSLHQRRVRVVRAARADDRFMRRYTRQVIDVGWPMQRRGIVLKNATATLKDFQDHLMSFEPGTERQKILAVEAYAAYNELTQSWQARLNSVTEEMPGPLWVLVIVGARAHDLPDRGS
jgi:hypothetical protein